MENTTTNRQLLNRLQALCEGTPYELRIEHADSSIMYTIYRDFRDDKTPRKSLLVGLFSYLRPYSPVSNTPL